MIKSHAQNSPPRLDWVNFKPKTSSQCFYLSILFLFAALKFSFSKRERGGGGGERSTYILVII